MEVSRLNQNHSFLNDSNHKEKEAYCHQKFAFIQKDFLLGS